MELADPLEHGEWLKENTALATIIDPTSSLIEAYVNEADLGRIAVGTVGHFHPDDLGLPTITGTVTAIDDASSRVLPQPALASLHGGDVPVTQGPAPDHALIPETPVYRILLRPDTPVPAPAQTLRGKVLLEGERESFAARTLRVAMGVLVRESGF